MTATIIFIILLLLFFLVIMLYSFLMYYDIIPNQEQSKLKATAADELNSLILPAGFQYNPLDDIFYSTVDCWQREFGYCRLYDETAPTLSMIIDCEPIYFYYKGKRWLIELWKGQYGMTTGAEIGIYATEKDNIHANGIFDGPLFESICDSEMLKMSFQLKKNGKLLFERKERHWWLTGFKLGTFSQPEELSMDVRITFSDNQMCQAFANGLLVAGYLPSDFKKRFRAITFTFAKPKTRQPATRTEILSKTIQFNNRLYCKQYRSLTKDYSTTYDKLLFLRKEYPHLYELALKLAQSDAFYKIYQQLEKSPKDKKCP